MVNLSQLFRQLKPKVVAPLIVALVAAVGVTVAFAIPAADSGDGEWDGVGVTGEDGSYASEPIPTPHLSGACNVGSLKGDRVLSSGFEFATGAIYGPARDDLADPANFGPSGVVDQSFQLLPAVHDVTAANLADTQIFWGALLLNSDPLSSAEQQALLDFVQGGGALVIVADVHNFSIGPNSMAAPFGVQWDNFSFLNTGSTITNPTHAIINGPFGTVGAIAQASEGSIEDLAGC